MSRRVLIAIQESFFYIRNVKYLQKTSGFLIVAEQSDICNKMRTYLQILIEHCTLHRLLMPVKGFN